MAGSSTIPIPVKKGILSTGSRLKNRLTRSMGVSSAITNAPFSRLKVVSVSPQHAARPLINFIIHI
jgi:hypothetical protein